MGETDPRIEYALLKLWCRHASARAPNPYQIDMEKSRGGFQNIYQWEDLHPPVLPLATHVDPVQVNDVTLSEAEVKAVVFHLRPLKSGVHTHLCANHYKQWLRES